ncbi:MAG TPA: glycoside hydrolase family 3 N-terminal domain-containing protein [Thermoleophilaceae bacterium]|nr:glycoside hydrolase family 3 N-terminal domain-containing protein [Thermoleophilaceae bacterium]
MRLSRDPAARRRLLVLCAVGGAAALAGAVMGSRAGEGDRGEGAAPGRRSVPAGAERRGDPAARLALERQVGQLLVMSFDGVEAPEYIRRRLRRGEGSGVILFGKNAADESSVKALTGALQREAGGGALLATDQEGGSIRSLGFAPPRSSQGALGDPASARASASQGARALRAAALNVNLAPVADVARAGSVLAGRAYPGDARAVSPLVGVAVRAHGGERVGATAKHFPGLGRASENTDDAPVTIDASRPELEGSDLVPFRAAIDAGVPLVMSSHALYPAYDRDRIASQSPVVLRELLRRQMGFRGAVITDSIEARAVLARSGVAVAAERAVSAGSDLVLMTGSGSWNQVYPHLLRRARSSAGFRARVREATGRVLALKRRLGLRVPGPE